MGTWSTLGVCLCFGTLLAAAGDEAASWDSLQNIGVVAFHADRFADALSAFEKALPLASSPYARAATLNGIGNSLRGLGRNAEAAERLERALSAWRDIDPAGAHTAHTAIGLANTQRALGRYAEAERTLRAALDAHPREPATIAYLQNALGDLLREQDHLIEARKMFESALQLSSERGEPRMDALVGIADIEREFSEYQPAIGHWTEALALARELHSATEALALRGLGQTYSDMGDIARAEPVLRRAVAMFEGRPGLDFQYAAALVCLGTVYRDEHKPGLAEQMWMRALDLEGGLNSAADPQAGVVLQFLAGIRATQKRFAEASEFAQRSWNIMNSAFGPSSTPAAGALATIAFVEAREGELDAAERHYADALRIMREKKVANSGPALEMMDGYAAVLRKLHRNRDAKALEGEIKAFHSGSRR